MPRVQRLWVLVGVVFIYVSQLLLGLAGRAFGAGVEQLAGLQALSLAFTLIAFSLGGFVVGLFSPGATVIGSPLAPLVATILDVALPPATAAQLGRCSAWRSSSWRSGCSREWSGWACRRGSPPSSSW